MDWIYIILIIVGIVAFIAVFIIAYMIDEKRPYSFTNSALKVLEELEKEHKSHD